MNNRNFVVLGTVMFCVFLLQFYFMFQIDKKINVLSKKETQVSKPHVTKGPLYKPVKPIPGPDDTFFKDHSWNPYEEIQRMQSEMERVFGDSFSRFHKQSPLGSFNKSPDVNLEEKPDHFIVTVNAPGADESSLKVKLEDQQLHISIKTEHTEEKTDDKNGQYSYRERFMGEFQRILTLPGPANASEMKTKYRNGVLTITIPKK